ncbi:putative phage protein (TIGR02218 family) [Hoeflea marina]|uniref:Putative phage protein (TIGR02218 family) n=1 Tax=Hoeflea marina TaxID=274592 RepID=A0A317PRM7_9HYPH|nr:DUF2163 domain-containing protein [Hoeflea marina]PWW02220.1 putative phage protein (TIGR02218 family) [Hoeflea marina]
MRQLPDDLAVHLEGEATTTCHAWRLTRSDGLVLGFTDHDRDLDFAGCHFAAESGFVGSEVETGLGLGADSADVTGAFSAAAITTEDLTDGRYDSARVETFLVNWQSPEAHLLVSTRELGEVRASGDAYRAELRSLASRLDRPQGRVYARRCDADLGDHRCRVALDDPAFGGAGTVSAVLDESRLAVAGFEGFADGWFRHGRLRFDTGRFAGLSFEISEHRAGPGGVTLELWSPLAALPEPESAVTLTAGCDKLFATCSEKFANILNFQGFPYLPGSDFAYGYADGDTVHDGRPIVP